MFENGITPQEKIVLKINLSKKDQIKNVFYSEFDNKDLVLVFSKILNNTKRGFEQLQYFTFNEIK